MLQNNGPFSDIFVSTVFMYEVKNRNLLICTLQQQMHKTWVCHLVFEQLYCSAVFYWNSCPEKGSKESVASNMDSLLRAVCLLFVPWQHHLLLAGVQASLDQNTQTVFGSLIYLILRWHYNTTYHIDPWAGWQPGKPELHDIKPESSDKTFLDKDTFS